MDKTIQNLTNEQNKNTNQIHQNTKTLQTLQNHHNTTQAGGWAGFGISLGILLVAIAGLVRKLFSDKKGKNMMRHVMEELKDKLFMNEQKRNSEQLQTALNPNLTSEQKNKQLTDINTKYDSKKESLEKEYNHLKRKVEK